AVFYEPQQAIKAALNIQLHVDEFNATLRTDEKIVIKIGIHHGPAIAVNSNDKLDYFGRTVNIAARIQGTSIGGDIVVSEECLHRQGVQHVLQEYQ
ncbi:adenylate/guanylate cyclase domain-containing protein, partial [Klebsiella pneumoniae]|nr:adenylate/guanylate cyclase domain-containing protein [Klebsiella pneumoniae]